MFGANLAQFGGLYLHIYSFETANPSLESEITVMVDRKQDVVEFFEENGMQHLMRVNDLCKEVFLN